MSKKSSVEQENVSLAGSVKPLQNDLLFSFHRGNQMMRIPSVEVENAEVGRLSEEIEELQQKVDKLTFENHQYERLLQEKS